MFDHFTKHAVGIIRTLFILGLLLMMYADHGRAQTTRNINAQQLIDILKEPGKHDEDRIKEAIIQLGTLSFEQQKPAIPYLKEYLKAPNNQIREFTVNTIGSILLKARDEKRLSEVSDVVQELEARLKDETDESVLITVANALANAGRAAGNASQTLLNRLRSEGQSPEVRQAIISALSLSVPTPTRENVNTLISNLDPNCPETPNCINIARVLEEMGADAKGAIDKLIEVLKVNQSRDPGVLAQAVAALVAIDLDQKQARTVVSLLKDELQNEASTRRNLRASVANAFGKIDLHDEDARDVVDALSKRLESKTEDNMVRRAAARSLGRLGSKAKKAIPALKAALADQAWDIRYYSAEALRDIAQALLAKGDIGANEALEDAYRDLERMDPKPNNGQFAMQVEKALDTLKRESLVKTVLQSRYFLGIAAYLIIIPVVWLILLWLRPLWLLRSSEALTNLEYELPGWLGGIRLPVRSLLLLSLFHYRRRVLDAWVAKHADSVQSKFENRSTVKERKVYITSVPFQLDGNEFPALTTKDLRPFFTKRKICLLIWGEEGLGKTSMACRIARWAIAPDGAAAQGLADHLMMPVLIEPQTNLSMGEGSESFIEAIRGQLQDMIQEPTPVSKELLNRLLRHQRILVIVDDFSKLDSESQSKIQPGSAEFPVYALIVTSRFEETLSDVSRILLKPLPIKGSQLSTFIDAYLKQQGKRDMFRSELEFFAACSRLSSLVGDEQASALLAKLYADQLSASQDGGVEPRHPRTIPDLMLSYINYLNDEAGGGGHKVKDIHNAVKVLAWKCVEEYYRPTTANLDQVISAMGETDKSTALIEYLEDQLHLIQITGVTRDEIMFTLDPMAEYLAGLFLVERYGDDQQKWQGFFLQADKVRDSPEAMRDFLLAVRECCSAKGLDASVVNYISTEVTRRVDPDSASSNKAA